MISEFQLQIYIKHHLGSLFLFELDMSCHQFLIRLRISNSPLYFFIIDEWDTFINRFIGELNKLLG